MTDFEKIEIIKSKYEIENFLPEISKVSTKSVNQYELKWIVQQAEEGLHFKEIRKRMTDHYVEEIKKNISLMNENKVLRKEIENLKATQKETKK